MQVARKKLQQRGFTAAGRAPQNDDARVTLQLKVPENLQAPIGIRQPFDCQRIPTDFRGRRDGLHRVQPSTYTAPRV
jgi:hypothetical protein